MTTTRIIQVACSEAKYLVRCECRKLRGYMDREACSIHGPAQPVVYGETTQVVERPVVLRNVVTIPVTMAQQSGPTESTFAESTCVAA